MQSLCFVGYKPEECLRLATHDGLMCMAMLKVCLITPDLFSMHSCWVQVGLTDATQYEHRVGRTGRAGKDGEALLLLADDESRLLPTLKDFPLQPAGAAGKPTAAGRVAAAAQQQQQYGGDGYGSSGRGLVTAAQLGQWRWDGLSQGLAAVGRDDALLKSGEQAFVATLGFLAGGWSRIMLTQCNKHSVYWLFNTAHTPAELVVSGCFQATCGVLPRQVAQDRGRLRFIRPEPWL